jgi:hypothetical protein
MRKLRCDNCNTNFNVHEDCDIVICPGCKCKLHAKPGTPPFGTESGDSELLAAQPQKG